MSKNQKFVYVLFNTRTGTIIDELEPSTDSILNDINATGTIELEIPFATLTSAQRKDIDNHFKAINRSVAVLIKNDLGEPFACVGGGIITSREFSVTDESAYLQAAGFSEYLNMVPTVWTTSEIKGGNVPVQSWSGRPDQLYTSILNSALGGGSGINTVTSWDTKFSSVDTRTATLSFPIDEFPTALDSMTTVRDELFEGSAPEFNIHPTLDIANNKIVWVFVNSNDVDEPQINMGTTKLLPVMPARPQVQEVTDYQITEDTSEMYNFLTIDATDTNGENVIAHIKSINKTVGSELTLFQSFDTGVPLTDSEMSEQLNARVEGSSDPIMTTTVVLTGEQVYNLGYFTKAWIINGNITIESGLGSRVEARAGAKATGLGTTLRLVELKFSLRDYDVNTTLSLSSISNTYPSLPEQEKKKSNEEKKKNKQRSSESKKRSIRTRIKKVKIKGKKLKGIDNKLKPKNDFDSFDGEEWKPAPSDGGSVGGKDEPESADPKPNVLSKSKPSTYTIGSYEKLINTGSKFSPVFEFKGHDYIFTYNYNDTEIYNPIDIENPNPSYGEETKGIIVLNMINIPVSENNNGDIIENTNSNYAIKMKSFQDLRNLAPNRFPNKIFLDYVRNNPDVYLEDNMEVDNIWGDPQAKVKTGFYCFVINGRFYGHYFSISSPYQDSSVTPNLTNQFTGLLGEVFFTAEIDESNLELKNYEVLTSPAEQLYGTNGTNFCISMNNLATSPMNTETLSNESPNQYNRNSNLFSKGVYLNNNTPYFDFSNNWKECVFFNTGFFSSAKGARIYNWDANNDGDIMFTGGVFSEKRTLDIGMTNEMLNVDFGLLEGDFSNKQPIFKNSKIGLPVPKKKKWAKVINVMDNGYMVLGSSSDGDFTYAPTRGFKYVTSINKNGVAISYKFNLDENKFNELWDGFDYNDFESKYTNRIWSIDKDKKWKENKLDTNHNLSNQVFTPCSVMPDGEVLTSLRSENNVIESRTSDKYNKVEGVISLPYDILSKPMSVLQDKNVTSNKKFSFFNTIETSNNSFSTYIWNAKYSKYKYEISQTPSNNSIGILKSKNSMIFNGRWEQTSSFIKDTLSSILQISNGKKLESFKSINTKYSNIQKNIDIKLDFKEFSSFGGCNIGIDSNGDVWQWGVKLTTQVQNSLTAQNTFLNDDETLNNGVNWEPVKIDLPFKVEKLDITGLSTQYGSVNKALVLLSKDGKVYTMGYIDSNHNLTGTWRDVTQVTSSIAKFTDVKFRYNGLALISESLDFCYSGLNPNGSDNTSISNIVKVDNPLWNGKVKNIRSTTNRANPSVKALFTTTDGKAYIFSSKATDQNGQVIDYEGKIENIFFNNATPEEMLLYITSDGKLFYHQKSESNVFLWNEVNYASLSMPSGFKAKEWIHNFNSVGTPIRSMVYGVSGSGITSSGAVISMEACVSNLTSWTPDNVGSMYSDKYVYGSEVETGSLIPEFDFLNDGEGSTGQDWGGGSWLPTNGTPMGQIGENDFDTGEGTTGKIPSKEEIGDPTNMWDGGAGGPF